MCQFISVEEPGDSSHVHEDDVKSSEVRSDTRKSAKSVSTHAPTQLHGQRSSPASHMAEGSMHTAKPNAPSKHVDAQSSHGKVAPPSHDTDNHPRQAYHVALLLPGEPTPIEPLGDSTVDSKYWNTLCNC